jgi:hypothetical protein
VIRLQTEARSRNRMAAGCVPPTTRKGIDKLQAIVLLVKRR